MCIRDRWSDLHPGIRVDIREERSREILLAVRDGVADVGIVTTRPRGQDLHFIPYCRDRLCLIVPQDPPVQDEPRALSGPVGL